MNTEQNDDGSTLAPLTGSAAEGEDRYWGLWQRVNMAEYRRADGMGKCVMRLNDPMHNNAWIYLVFVPTTWDGRQPNGEVCDRP